MSKWLDAAKKIHPYIRKAVQFLPDEDAIQAKTLYPSWEELILIGKVESEVGFKFHHNGELYKCTNANPTFQSDWVPGLHTSALYVRIDESGAGDISNPIVADRGMEYIYGSYYLDPADNKVYLCTRAGEIDGNTVVLAYLPHELVGHYFKEVTT